MSNDSTGWDDRQNDSPIEEEKFSLFNPFRKITGFRALFIGLIAMALTAMIAVPCKGNFIGTLSIHFGTDFSFGVIFSMMIIGWLALSFCSWVFVKPCSGENVRVIDILGPLAMTRLPWLFVVGFGLLISSINLSEPLNSSNTNVILFIAVIAMLVDIYVVILCYHAFFPTKTKVNRKWIFALVLLVSELVGTALSVGFLFTMTQQPISPEILATIETMVPPVPEDKPRVEIAQKIVTALFEGNYKAPSEFYDDTVKEKLSPLQLRINWWQFCSSKGTHRGVGSPIHTDVVEEYHRIFVPLQFENGDLGNILIVFDSQNKVAGFFLLN